MSSTFLPVPKDISNIIVRKLEPPDIINTAKSSKAGLFSVTPVINSYCNDPITVREIELYVRDTIEEQDGVIFSILDGYGRYSGNAKFPDKTKSNDPIISVIQIFKEENSGKEESKERRTEKNDLYLFTKEKYALKTGIITRTNDEELQYLKPSIPVVAFIEEHRGIYKGLKSLIETTHDIIMDKDTSIGIYARRHICNKDALQKLLIDKYTEFVKKGTDSEDEHPMINFTLPGAIRRKEIRDDYLAIADTKQYGPLEYELCDLKETRNVLYMGLFKCDIEGLRYQVYA